MHGEIAYLLHLRSRENPELGYKERLGEALKDMDPTKMTYNFNVMVALIESGYLQSQIKASCGRAAYPIFLITLLRDCDIDSVSDEFG